MAVHIVWDLADTPQLSERLDRHGAGGVGVVHPTPGIETTRELAADILIGVGKHYDALRRERQLRRAWQLAGLWLRAENIEHLVVLDAHLLRPGLAERLATLPTPHLWLVHRGDQPAGSHPDGLQPLLAAIPEPPRTLEAGAGIRQVTLPLASFLTFRASCRDLLPPDQFKIVDAIYLDAFDTTLAWFDQQPAGTTPTLPAVLGQLRALIGSATTTEETIVRLRAAQAAYLHHGALLGFDPVHNPTSSTRWELPIELPALGLHPEYSRRVRGLVSPHLTACHTLRALGLSVSNIAHLTLGDISLDARTIDVRQDPTRRYRFEIPEHALSLLKAQILDRIAADAGPGSWLFITSKGQHPQPHTIANWVRQTAANAHVWQPDEQLWPLWHPTPVTGYRIKIVTFEPT